MDKTLATNFIRAKAKELGFLQVGFSPAGLLKKEAKKLKSWLDGGNHGEMSYMENYFDKRTDPTELIPGSKTVISFSYNYYTDKTQSDSLAPKISKYAYGRDYHKVIKGKLKSLFSSIQNEFDEVEGRYFVDSAPILEREWARRSGIGWVGKNTMIINPKEGSYFFLAEMILNIELNYDSPIDDHCGTCTKCIEACPTDAISEEGYSMDGSKCISYLTIELKNEIPTEFSGKMENWIFGCDICQDVCPWNRFSKNHNQKEFEPKQELIEKSEMEWKDLDEDIFEKLFEGSAVKRTKYSGLKRNIKFLKKS